MRNNLLMKIGEVSEVFDGPHATPKKIDVGPYFLSISSLEKGQLDLSKSAHLSENQFIKWTKRVTPQEGDVLFSYETRLGEAALMPAKITACLGRRMGLLRPDRTKVLPEYLLYAYLSPAFQQEIKKRTIHGATVERIALRELPDFNIRVPTLEEQGKVVANLNAINGKITLNKQTNQTLEQMAQTLFKSWFVDFDPVFDNLLAKIDFDLSKLPTDFPEFLKKRATKRLHALNTTETGRATLAKLQKSSVLANSTNANKDADSAIDKNIHHHFPSEFEYNEQLGWIPKWWEDVAVNEMVKTVSETYPLKTVDKVVFLNTGDILEGKFLHKNYSESRGLPGQAKKSIKKGDILYSEIRPKNKRFALVNFDGNEHVVSTKLMVLRPNKGFEELFPYFVLTQDKNIALLQRSAESRSGTFPQITYTELAMIRIALPQDKKLMIKFVDTYLKDHFAQKDQREFQNETLTKLRDTLLPKLISGELSLSNVAEKRWMKSELTDLPLLPDEIKDAARDGNLVLFIGAGVSLLAGYPSWAEFAQRALNDLLVQSMVDYAELDQLKKMNDPKKQLSIANIIAIDNKNQLQFNNYVTKQESNNSRIYEYINSLNVVCVTTNYDNELTGKDISTINRISNPEGFRTVDLNKPGTVVHLHGEINKTTEMIVTTRDYLSHYEKKDVTDFLQRLFHKHTVLFIGSGFEEIEILEYVFRNKETPFSKKRFLLQPFFSHEKSSYDLLKKYYETSFSVNLIGYLRDKKDFSQLEEIIGKWTSELTVNDLHILDKLADMDEILDDE